MTDARDQAPEQLDTMTDEEFFAARREAMGEDYPGDEAMRQFDREADADFEAMREREAAAEAQAQEAAAPKEWNAGDWLREAFKDDPGFDKLSEEDFAKLEALAEERHQELSGEIHEWATEKRDEWMGELKESVHASLESSPRLQEFFETRVADGEMSDADKAELNQIAQEMSPAEAAGVLRPIAEQGHEIIGELIDGVEMIADEAIEDIQLIVETRADMPGGDAPEVQTMLHKLEEAPAQVHDALDWEREQQDLQWEKAEDKLDLIEAGADPRSLVDTDTYQVDPNAGSYETEEA